MLFRWLKLAMVCPIIASGELRRPIILEVALFFFIHIFSLDWIFFQSPGSVYLRAHDLCHLKCRSSFDPCPISEAYPLLGASRVLVVKYFLFILHDPTHI